MNKKIIITAVFIVLILLAVVLFSVYRNTNTTSSISIPTSDLKSISLSEVANHNNQNSCWTVINSKVYDVTKFIPQHEGGERILNACGIDATDLFTGKSPMGRMHSMMAQKLLSSMQIGTLQR